MEIENILSILIKKLEPLIQELGVFTPEELMYLFGLFIITLFLLTNVVICLEKTFPRIIKILKVSIFGVINIIMFMTMIMFGHYIIYTNNNISIDNINNLFWEKVNKFSFPIISEEIITWMRTPLNEE